VKAAAAARAVPMPQARRRFVVVIGGVSFRMSGRREVRRPH
jgi:hypothetical protein